MNGNKKLVFKHFMVSTIIDTILPNIVGNIVSMVLFTHQPSRCSGNFWSSKTNETALVKLLDFSVTSQSHRAQASATVLSQDQVNLSLEGLRGVFEIWLIRC